MFLQRSIFNNSFPTTVFLNCSCLMHIKPHLLFISPQRSSNPQHPPSYSTTNNSPGASCTTHDQPQHSSPSPSSTYPATPTILNRIRGADLRAQLFRRGFGRRGFGCARLGRDGSSKDGEEQRGELHAAGEVRRRRYYGQGDVGAIDYK